MYCTRAPCFARRVASFHLSIMATPDTIAHVLASTLNPDSSVRIAAELNLSELLKSPRKVAVCLPLSSLMGHRRVGALTCTTRALSGCRVVSTTDECFILSCVCTGRFLMTFVFCGQHSAIIILRKYVKEHWSPFFQQFRGDAPPPEVSCSRSRWIAITEWRDACMHVL